jgi:hypothetical protein
MRFLGYRVGRLHTDDSQKVNGEVAGSGGQCKGNLTDLRRELHLSIAKGNPK